MFCDPVLGFVIPIRTTRGPSSGRCRNRKGAVQLPNITNVRGGAQSSAGVGEASMSLSSAYGYHVIFVLPR